MTITRAKIAGQEIEIVVPKRRIVCIKGLGTIEIYLN